jgi:hypothetical protein
MSRLSEIPTIHFQIQRMLPLFPFLLLFCEQSDKPIAKTAISATMIATVVMIDIEFLFGGHSQ